MTDCEFLLEVLADGREHTLTDILRASIEQRGHGLTVHSRVADLRARGHEIEHVTIAGAQRGAGHAYRLRVASLAEPEALPAPTLGAGGAPLVSGSANDALSLFQIPESARGAYDQDVAA
jgi:hypothetical protein